MYLSFASLSFLGSLVVDEKEKAGIVPVVAPLLPEQLDNAFETQKSAFKADPLLLYLKAGKEWSPFRTAFYKRLWKNQRKRELERKLAYTINAGDAFVIATPPESPSSRPSPVNRALNSIIGGLLRTFVLRSEQLKRVRELESKSSKVVKDELGDNAKAMYYLDILATKPEAQGHGYGSALLKTILFSADLRGSAVYLFSSNTANVPFYETFGFVHTADVLLGDDNPKWEHPPIVVPLMVRLARTHFKECI